MIYGGEILFILVPVTLVDEILIPTQPAHWSHCKFRNRYPSFCLAVLGCLFCKSSLPLFLALSCLFISPISLTLCFTASAFSWQPCLILSLGNSFIFPNKPVYLMGVWTCLVLCYSQRNVPPAITPLLSKDQVPLLSLFFVIGLSPSWVMWLAFKYTLPIHSFPWPYLYL